MSRVGAILLAGGRASRMGGVPKPLLDVGGQSLLHRAVDAVRGVFPLTVASPVLDPELAVDWVREDPPFGGPAAAVVAVLAEWRGRGADAEWTFLLACDLAHPDAVVTALREALADLDEGADGACLVDASGERQWLAGIYRTAALRRAAETLDDLGRGAPLRALLAGLPLVEVAAGAAAIDIDTWQDLDEARARAARQEDS